MTGKKDYAQSAAVVLLFTITGFLLYFPILGNGFLSDDYDSLYRIYIEKRILYKEFLRPMIDVSFWFNYIISGFSPRSYYIFNVLVHIINALLLFRVARNITIVSEKDQFTFAFLSAFLFLIYPFHNESIAWLSGRLSSMACFFALLSLLFSGKMQNNWRVLLSVLCYLAGLLCYESIIILPVIVFVLNWRAYSVQKRLKLYSLYWLSAMAVYFFTKIWLSGQITGNYGSHMIENNVIQKLLNIGKVLSRLFIPPSDNKYLLTGLTVGLIILLIILHRYLFKKKIANIARYNYKAVLICLVVSLLIPVAFSVSTRTSESDRLLYFPSCFFCMLATSWLILLFEQKLSRRIALMVIGFYCALFLEINNQHWVKASEAAKSIIQAVTISAPSKVILINVPDELEGAFVFRHGFNKMMVINRIDTSNIKVFNYLSRPEYVKEKEVIIPVVHDSVISIFPVTQLLANGQQWIITNKISNESLSAEKERNLIFYWNKQKLVKLF